MIMPLQWLVKNKIVNLQRKNFKSQKQYSKLKLLICLNIKLKLTKKIKKEHANQILRTLMHVIAFFQMNFE